MFAQKDQQIQDRIDRVLQRQNSKSKVSEINLNSLKSYCHYIHHEYQTTLIEYANEEDQLNALDQKLNNVVDKMINEKQGLNREKNQCERQLENAKVEQENYKSKASGLQEQINILQEIYQISNQKLAELRRENLDLQTQNTEANHMNDLAEEKLVKSSEKLSEKKKEILDKMNKNQIKIKEGHSLSNAIEESEEKSYNIIKKIQQNDSKIYSNSIKIQDQLNKQEKIVQRYEQLKKSKQIFKKKIIQLNEDLKEQDNQTIFFTSFEEQITYYLNQKQKQVTIENESVFELQQKLVNEQKSLEQNTINLKNLMIYLQYLVNQSQKIQQKIEQTLVEDILIKETIDRKFQNKYASRLKNYLVFEQISQNCQANMDKVGKSTANSEQGFFGKERQFN